MSVHIYGNAHIHVSSCGEHRKEGVLHCPSTYSLATGLANLGASGPGRLAGQQNLCPCLGGQLCKSRNGLSIRPSRLWEFQGPREHQLAHRLERSAGMLLQILKGVRVRETATPGDGCPCQPVEMDVLASPWQPFNPSLLPGYWMLPVCVIQIFKCISL